MLSLWPIPAVIDLIVFLAVLWPRYDGGGIHYNLMLISATGPGGIDLQWYIVGALLFPWCVWGVLVAVF